MEFSSYFPVWDKLTPSQQQFLAEHISPRKASKGTVIHNGALHCTGVFLIKKGQLRAYYLSNEGREITLYRLFERDMSLFSAACMMNSIQFEIIIETEKDSEMWLIPPHIYKQLMSESAVVANYTTEVMATRFSDVMWLMEQVLWKSFDKRLADFLLTESDLENSDILKITHESIGNHLGNPREVVTRMLRYFQNEGIVQLTRGSIEITDKEKLTALTER